MRKKICGMILFGALLISQAAGVHAETLKGSTDWNVSFTAEEKMVSSFKTNDLDDTIYGLQPGDNAIIQINLKNQNKASTDWYMTNEVLYSLEDRSTNTATGGGAYTYRLTYTDMDGEVTALFDSDTVGGENASGAGEGLHAATDALKDDYIFLDTLSKGDAGYITLEVALDGETQGNDYQNTLADLQMNFAVEMATASTSSRRDPEQSPLRREETPTQQQRQPGQQARPTNVVRTGDETNLSPFITAACVSGILLLAFAVYCMGESRKQTKGAQ